MNMLARQVLFSFFIDFYVYMDITLLYYISRNTSLLIIDTTWIQLELRPVIVIVLVIVIARALIELKHFYVRKSRKRHRREIFIRSYVDRRYRTSSNLVTLNDVIRPIPSLVHSLSLSLSTYFQFADSADVRSVR